MRFHAASLYIAVLLLTISQGSSPAQEKAVAKKEVIKWEYAELSYRTLPQRPAGKDADGNEVPATAASTTIRWTTGSDEFTLSGWGELAEKMKVEFKKDASPASQRLQALNALGSAGWELVEQQVPSTSGAMTRGREGPVPVSRTASGTMLFKRRAQ
jgi:hypothetical protein